MFAQKREQAKLGRVTSVAQKKQDDILPAAKEIPEIATSASKESQRTHVNQVLLDEIQENILDFNHECWPRWVNFIRSLKLHLELFL